MCPVIAHRLAQQASADPYRNTSGCACGFGEGFWCVFRVRNHRKPRWLGDGVMGIVMHLLLGVGFPINVTGVGVGGGVAFMECML